MSDAAEHPRGLTARANRYAPLVQWLSLALIALSYRFHFTYMGLAVYVTHDISDFFLAVSCSRDTARAREENES